MPELPKPIERYFLGIDPGASGGLAYVDSRGEARAIPMPSTEGEVWNWIARFIGKQTYAVIEKVSGWIGGNPGMNKQTGQPYKHEGQPGSAMFKFGRNYGMLRAFLVAAGFQEWVEWEAVDPKRWQKYFGIPFRKKGETKPQHKGRLRDWSLKYFPSKIVTLSTCDALLMAEYCRLTKAAR